MFVTACVYIVLLFSNEIAVLKKTMFNAFVTRIMGKHMYLHVLSYQIFFKRCVNGGEVQESIIYYDKLS